MGRMPTKVGRWSVHPNRQEWRRKPMVPPFFGKPRSPKAQAEHTETNESMSAQPAQVNLTQGVQFDTSLALRARVLSLYSLDTNTDQVIAETYHHRCKFVDPLVSTRGHREVKAQFRSLRAFLRQSKAELISSHYDLGSRNLTMDTMMVFKPKLWPFSSFRLRCFTVVVVGEDGLVRTHTDHWSVASLLETKVGWVYNVGRRAFGAVTSVFFGWLTRDSTPLALAGGPPHVPSAPPIADVVSVNPKVD